MGRYEKFREYIDKCRDKPFKWGEHDCCTFTCGWLKEYLGKDFMEEFRGMYNDEESANKILSESGGLEALAVRAFGQMRPSGFAKLGDVVIGETGNGIGLGLCAGEVSFFVGAKGLVRVLTVDMLGCWDV